MKYILALDQGTSSSRAIIYDQQFKVLAVGQKEFPQHYPQATWVEHDMDEIWESMESSVKEALQKLEKNGDFRVEDIAAIGITNQRETFALWERKTLKPVHKAIVWQCRRSADECVRLRKTQKGKRLARLTGLVLDPYFSGTKLKWLFDRKPQLKQRAKAGELAFGTIDTFLIARLSSGDAHVTDASNASRTLLMDLGECQWSAEALKTLDVPKEVLPEIKSSNALFGKTRGLKYLPDGIPIHGVLGDQQAALFGQACFKAGEAKVTYGTGAFLLMNVGKKIKRSPSALSTVAWKIGSESTYCLEGSIFIAGAAVQWLRDQLGMIKSSAEIESLAQSVENSDGVFFIPALSGLGSPYWKPEIRAMIGGLTRSSHKGHIARACLEALCHLVADQFEAIVKDSRLKLKALRVDGGAAKNNLMLQLQADYLQTRVLRPKDVESTARGAAYMAALGVGLFKSQTELLSQLDWDRDFTPRLSAKISQQERRLWKKRIKSLISAFA